MNVTAKTNTTVQAHEQETVSQIGIGLIGIMSALIGTWGATCLISGFCQYGVVGMIKGWVSAVMGG